VNWFAALLWLISGVVAGACGFAYLVARALYQYPMRRLEFLRLFAKRWPEDFERALLHTQVSGGHEDLTLEPIQFGTCHHCHFSWPIDERKLIEHPSIGSGTGATCKGSHTKDYHVSE